MLFSFAVFPFYIAVTLQNCIDSLVNTIAYIPCKIKIMNEVSELVLLGWQLKTSSGIQMKLIIYSKLILKPHLNSTL